MFLILSENTDCATTDVLYWLKHYNRKFVRINGADFLTVDELSLGDGRESSTITVNGGRSSFRIEDVKTYWYRRGFLNIYYFKVSERQDSYQKFTGNLNIKLDEDYKNVIHYLHKVLKRTNSINQFSDNNINKVEVLSDAQQLGLDIPPTLITSKKSQLERFSREHRPLITKAIYGGAVELTFDGFHMSWLTEKFDFDQLRDQIPEHFPLTLFQKAIEKKYELRIFYLKGAFYASCIFSQKDPKTQVDFRNYNKQVPNRVVPYKLPEALEAKLERLMRLQDLDSGSIDIIYGTDGKYYFLEVNPIGQFAQVSYPCNYFLEKKIAQTDGIPNT